MGTALGWKARPLSDSGAGGPELKCYGSFALQPSTMSVFLLCFLPVYIRRSTTYSRCKECSCRCLLSQQSTPVSFALPPGPMAHYHRSLVKLYLLQIPDWNSGVWMTWFKNSLLAAFPSQQWGHTDQPVLVLCHFVIAHWASTKLHGVKATPPWQTCHSCIMSQTAQGDLVPSSTSNHHRRSCQTVPHLEGTAKPLPS